ncbi:hypothetical protein JVT61DRAFT_639 [Boletus reticuloceps]|uniref:Uncharacterized protein n=1 Tax=Boletus reticuloceps TaxID=495285 RepID=A0A8I3AFV9_9AGAM|nr:hypothetical protein JVT61DRAFT_639 [Boletus reticuloceps]
MTGKASAETKLSPPDFWEMVNKSEKRLQDHVHRLLEGAASYFKTAKFTDVTSAMNHIVSATATFRNDIKGALDAHHITFDTLTKQLEGVFTAIANDLEKIPPPDKAPGHAERKKMVDKILDDTEQALIKLTSSYGIDEVVITTFLSALKPHVLTLMVTIGDINEQYPQLLPILIFSVVVLLVPESWFLRPFLSVLGFGPVGPVRGSVAAWLQERFWGAAVEPGSWFSFLQAAGMGVLPELAGFVIKASLLILGISAIAQYPLFRPKTPPSAKL